MLKNNNTQYLNKSGPCLNCEVVLYSLMNWKTEHIVQKVKKQNKQNKAVKKI